MRGIPHINSKIVVVMGAVAVLLAAVAVVLAGHDGSTVTGPSTQRPSAPSGSTGPAPEPTTTPPGVGGFGASPPAAPDRAPFPATRKTLPGASLHLRDGETFTDALRRSDRAYGPLRMVRVFFPGLPPPWEGSRADVVNRTVVVSFKAPPRDVAAGRHDSLLAAWFASMPRDVDVYWSFFHEPEDDVERGAYTPARFVAAFRRVAGLADRARNPRLRATLILMCWTLSPESGRSFDDYYPGSTFIDVLGWDCYNDGAKTGRYTEPARVFSRMIKKSRALGKPWGVAETGSLRIAGDSGGSGRAAWLRATSSYLNERGPLWVAYYDYPLPGQDYRLTDAPSRQAWKAWCTARPT